MKWQSSEILSILDKCSERFTFPMLDNGYVYPAATRLSLYRSTEDWAMVVEVFGFSPMSGVPDTQIHTFGSRLQRLKSVDNYVSHEAFGAYLANNPNNETTFIFSVEEGDWQDPENCELVSGGRHPVL